MFILIIAQFFIIALFAAVLRAVISAIIGSIRLHNNTKIVNIVVVSFATLFQLVFNMYYEYSLLIAICVTIINGLCVFLFFQQSDKREAKKNIKRVENKYMKDDFLDSQ